MFDDDDSPRTYDERIQVLTYLHELDDAEASEWAFTTRASVGDIMRWRSEGWTTKHARAFSRINNGEDLDDWFDSGLPSGIALAAARKRYTLAEAHEWADTATDLELGDNRTAACIRTGAMSLDEIRSFERDDLKATLELLIGYS